MRINTHNSTINNIVSRRGHGHANVDVAAGTGLPTKVAAPARRRQVTFDEGRNRVHFVFGSHAYDRSSYRSNSSSRVAEFTNNADSTGGDSGMSSLCTAAARQKACAAEAMAYVMMM